MTGLGQALSDGLARWRAPRAVHDPGKILTDLVVALALGGDCLADVAVLTIGVPPGGRANTQWDQQMNVPARRWARPSGTVRTTGYREQPDLTL